MSHPNPTYEPEIDICPECGEHAEFEREDDNESAPYVSNCCGAPPYNTDPDLEER